MGIRNWLLMHANSLVALLCLSILALVIPIYIALDIPLEILFSVWLSIAVCSYEIFISLFKDIACLSVKVLNVCRKANLWKVKLISGASILLAVLVFVLLTDPGPGASRSTLPLLAIMIPAMAIVVTINHNF